MKLWLARDEDGRLYLHFSKPYKVHVAKNIKAYWNNEDENWMRLRDEAFPEVTFENSPQEVELVIKER